MLIKDDYKDITLSRLCHYYFSESTRGTNTKTMFFSPYIYILYIHRIIFFYICMSLFESTLLSFCNPLSKLDIPTLRQGSRERKNATEHIKNMTLARIQTQAHGSSRRCSTNWAWIRILASVIFLICSVVFFLYLPPWRSVGRSNFALGLQKLNNVDSNKDIQI